MGSSWNKESLFYQQWAGLGSKSLLTMRSRAWESAPCNVALIGTTTLMLRASRLQRLLGLHSYRLPERSMRFPTNHSHHNPQTISISNSLTNQIKNLRPRTRKAHPNNNSGSSRAYSTHSTQTPHSSTLSADHSPLLACSLLVWLP